MSPSAVATLAERLVFAYALDAWPFAVLHFVVVVYLGRSILRMVQEAAELRAWEPTAETPQGPAAVLSSFIRDSADMGERGFVVPITDYSDRLDSEVENLVNEVADRTNMLLLVGIAGTLFGVFEFASRAIAVQGDPLKQIGLILAESMAKAFPVGFVGLMLMLVFQLSLATPVSGLYRASSEATRRALEHRGIVSRTVAESIGASIAESMRPVSTLGVTVSEHLQPVVTALGERLEQSLSLMKLQFVEIDQSTQRFIKATSNLHQSTNALTNTSARLEDLLKATPRVLANTERIQQLQNEAIEELRASFRRNLEDASVVAASLHRVRESTEGLPEELMRQTVAAIQPAFERLATDAVVTWDSLVRNVGGGLQRDYAEFIRQMREEITKVHEAIGGAADEWQRLADSSQALISEPLRIALDGIAVSSQRGLAITDGLAVSLNTVVEDLALLPERLAERSATAIQPVFDRVANESSQTWRELVRVVAIDIQRDYAELVASSRHEVELANQGMRAAAEEMRRLAEGAQASLTEPIQTAIETARRETSIALEEVSEFVRERYPAIRNDMQEFGGEMAAIVRTLHALEQRLSTTTFPTSRAAEKTNESTAMLEAILEELRAQAPRRREPETFWQRLLGC